jgi:hypothetical protein
MRWSERPPAVRSRFAWLQLLRSGPSAVSVAVAHLVLVSQKPVLLQAQRLKYRIDVFEMNVE